MNAFLFVHVSVDYVWVKRESTGHLGDHIEELVECGGLGVPFGIVKESKTFLQHLVIFLLLIGWIVGARGFARASLVLLQQLSDDLVEALLAELIVR